MTGGGTGRRQGNVHTRIYMKINHRYVAVKFIGFMLINLTIFNLLFACFIAVLKWEMSPDSCPQSKWPGRK